MVLLWYSRSVIILGLLTEVKEASNKAKLVRKKYMGAESVGLREMMKTEQVGQHSKQENEQKDNKEYFLQVWILCESQENKFSHIVGRPEDIHSASNSFLSLYYLQRIQNDT